MDTPASALPSSEITPQDWMYVQNLIQEVQREEMCVVFAKNLWQWDLTVKQFRKVEYERIVLGSPTKTDWECQAICLHALLALGKLLLLEVKKLTDAELTNFGVTRKQIEAYVAELDQSLREKHHAIPESSLSRVREKIFGGSS